MVKTIDSERLTTEVLGIQRWEDEGGRMIEGNKESHDLVLVRPALVRARKRVTSLRWNERFVIQPFRPSVGMSLIREKQASKPTGR